MVWQRNSGQDEEEILQNRFTAYITSAVQRYRAAYIQKAQKHQQEISLIDAMLEDKPVSMEEEAMADIPLLMKLENNSLAQAMLQLSDRERHVFMTRVLEERSFESLAQEIGLSYKGVSAIYYRAIQKIKKYMKEVDE